MAKFSSIYICQQCGFRSSQFLGKCPECGTWNSLVETIEESSAQSHLTSDKKSKAEIVNLKDVNKENYQRTSTGIEEFDRVLGGPASPDGSQGGGIVQGSVVLVSGDPGIGKSTLLLQLALNKGLGTRVWGLDKSKQKEKLDPNNCTLNSCLYVAGEESAHQIKIRAERIKKGAELAILNEIDVDIICEVVRKIVPKLLIVDSVQTLETQDLSSGAGSVGQVRECSHRLQRLAKELHVPIFLVGHVTKEGNIAGPKTLEHLVDVVLSLEGDPTTNFRILRSNKNRFGSTDEVGIFEMEEGGMIEVKNPSKLFLQTGTTGVPGSAVVATLTGLRPLLVEIQALVTKSFLPVPVRRASGIDNNRLQLLVAVLQKRLGLPLYNQDIFVNVTGGLKVLEPAADLAICMAIISSLKDKPLKPHSVLLGEVGLLGELRPVRQLQKRITEAKKLGYANIISSDNIKSLGEAVTVGIRD